MLEKNTNLPNLTEEQITDLNRELMDPQTPYERLVEIKGLADSRETVDVGQVKDFVEIDFTTYTDRMLSAFLTNPNVPGEMKDEIARQVLSREIKSPLYPDK